MSRRRLFGELDRQALLQAIGACRAACVDTVSKAPINGDVYGRTSALMSAIDDVAETLTGDRRHFWLTLHSSNSYMPPRNE